MKDLAVKFPGSTSKRATTVDLSQCLGKGYDDIVLGAASAFQQAVRSSDLRPSTMIVRLLVLRRDFFPWLGAASATIGRPIVFSDIDRPMLERFGAEVRRLKSHTETARKSFAAVTGMLRMTGRLGLSAPIEQIFPSRIFPPNQHEHAKPYSKAERQAILGALMADLLTIRNGGFDQSRSMAVAVYLLLLAFRTGFNTTSLLLLSRDAIREHPVRPDFRILVSFKHRANKEVSTSLRWSDRVEEFKIVGSDGIALYHELLGYTADLASAAAANRNVAFLRPPIAHSVDISAVPLTEHDLSYLFARFARIHKLVGDDGEALRISTRRIRATLAQRIDELSGGDPFVKAHILGNSPATANVNYSEPGPDGAQHFAIALAALQERLLSTPPSSVKTPVGACSDPLFGRYAPGDGVTHCERWINCFKCPNQCIIGEDDDLWRLYSFYWVLQTNSQRLRRMPISGLARFALYVMDNTLIERYGDKARFARVKARKSPHPFWSWIKHRDSLFEETADA